MPIARSIIYLQLSSISSHEDSALAEPRYGRSRSPPSPIKSQDGTLSFVGGTVGRLPVPSLPATSYTSLLLPPPVSQTSQWSNGAERQHQLDRHIIFVPSATSASYSTLLSLSLLRLQVPRRCQRLSSTTLPRRCGANKTYTSMPAIPRPSTTTSSTLSVALELFDARGWPDDGNDPGADPGTVDRWVIVSIVVFLILFMTIVGGYTCVAYYRPNEVSGNRLVGSQDDHGQPLIPLTPNYPPLPTTPSPARVRLSRRSG